MVALEVPFRASPLARGAFRHLVEDYRLVVHLDGEDRLETTCGLEAKGLLATRDFVDRERNLVEPR